MNPIISIIIPCYNDSQYITETVASAKAQTYSHCEIIIVDDHSTDSCTKDILGTFQDQGITVISTTSGHKGLSAARNTGINHAKGKYILPLDSDDLLEATYIEKAVAILECNANIDICYCKGRCFGLKQTSLRYAPENSIYTLFRSPHFITCVFSKADWEAVQGFDEELPIFEDVSFWLSLYALGKKSYCIPEELFLYRVRKGSIMSTASQEEKRRKAMIRIYEKNKAYLESRGLDIYLTLEGYIEKENTQNLLFSYKILSPLFHWEHTLRQWIKKLFGRA